MSVMTQQGSYNFFCPNFTNFPQTFKNLFCSFLFQSLKTKLDRSLTYSLSIYHMTLIQVLSSLHSSNDKVFTFHNYDLYQPKYETIQLVILIQGIIGLSVWLEKSKFTKFQRPQLNYCFIDFQGLENGNLFPRLSKTFKDCKNPALTVRSLAYATILIQIWTAGLHE